MGELFLKSTISVFGLVSILMSAPTDDIGPLSVVGNEIQGQDGQVAQLRGMSFYWSQAKAGRDFYNADVVNWLAEDWYCNIVRAAMAVEGDWSATEKGYLSAPEINKSRVMTVVDAAIAKGIYVIIDWHDHNAINHQSQAVSFFSEMANLYKDHPNVIYEIFNEPQDIPWEDIKNYSIPVIEAIRQHDEDNLIVVGTPKWASEVAVASRSPITGYSNIAYSFHFYASEQWHYDHYMAKADSALANGVALFVTEWGNSHASGNGTLNRTYMDAFMNWMTEKKLSWCNWSISDLSETSSALKAGNWDSQGNLVHNISTTGGWSTSELSESGAYTREKLRSLNPAWEPLVGTARTAKPQYTAVPVFAKWNGGGVEVRFGQEHNWHTAALYSIQGKVMGKLAVDPSRPFLRFDTVADAKAVLFLKLEGEKENYSMPVMSR